MEASYFDFDSRPNVGNRNSGMSGHTDASMTADELKARAEAAMAEKNRV